jgi:hypothetical protein
MIGKRELSREIENFSNTGINENIDISFLSAGIYIVRLSAENQELIRKLVIRKTDF